jgi:hypothetical protein
MFTAIMVTRLLLKVGVTKNAQKYTWLWLGKNPVNEQSVKS